MTCPADLPAKVLYISGPLSHRDLIHQVEANILAASTVALEASLPQELMVRWRRSSLSN